jgi:hypothetical protein
LFTFQEGWKCDFGDVFGLPMDSDWEDPTLGIVGGGGGVADHTGGTRTTAELLLSLLREAEKGLHAPALSEGPTLVDAAAILAQARLKFLWGVLDMWGSVFARMGTTLDGIDAAMGGDDVTTRLPAWRRLLGSWRHLLAGWRPSIRETSEFLALPPACGAAHSADQAALKSKYDSLGDNHEGLVRRVESTFQALMSTMSIIESKNAIAQAQSISKLTELAFVFIPLSFASSFFGMQVEVYHEDPVAWNCENSLTRGDIGVE